MTQQGTHWRKVHKRLNEHLLFAEDLGGRKSVVMEIIDSGIVAVADADGKKDMPWIAFMGRSGAPFPKRLALNVTNCKTLQTLFGTGSIEEWRGLVELVVVKTTFKDRKTKETVETDAIRIAPRRPSAKAAATNVPLDAAPESASSDVQPEDR